MIHTHLTGDTVSNGRLRCEHCRLAENGNTALPVLQYAALNQAQRGYKGRGFVELPRLDGQNDLPIVGHVHQGLHVRHEAKGLACEASYGFNRFGVRSPTCNCVIGQ